ncbi:hypothetical protein B0J17DRAFT_660673, partial [Rhizoctonia solani]
MANTSTTESNGTANSEVVVKHPKFFFDNTLIVIQIENVQFNVHKYQLLKSETFRDMFTIAEQSGADEQGSSTENPIRMEGVSSEDFESLLTVLYANHFSSHQPEPSASLIIPAFRLANMWNFSELRDYLKPLAEQVLNDANKIAFAREFHLEQWIVPAHVRLCHRKEPLDSDEAKMIGPEGVLLISRFERQGTPRIQGHHAAPSMLLLFIVQRAELRPPLTPLICPSKRPKGKLILGWRMGINLLT